MLTISTCIGCGAMSIPSRCPNGCGPERRLQLVAAAELDRLEDLIETSAGRIETLAGALADFLAVPELEPSPELRERARAALSRHDRSMPSVRAALEADPDPVVAWWCDRCGGLDAPMPCLGVCVRRPAQWANLEALETLREHLAAQCRREEKLAGAVQAVTLTRARPGSERRHRAALEAIAAQALDTIHAAWAGGPSPDGSGHP